LKLKLPEQDQIKDHRERCSADPTKLATIGRDVGQQIRIVRKDKPGFVAVYTVKQPNPPQDLGDPTRRDVIRTGQPGRERLGSPGELAVAVRATILDAPPPANKPPGVRFFEESKENRGQRYFIAIAPHGGKIEEHTDSQADQVHQELSRAGFPASLWLCRGFGDGVQGASARWHITATDIHPASFPKLKRLLARRFCYGVAFHGFKSSKNDPDVQIGGGAPDPLLKAVEKTLKNLKLPLKIVIGDDPDLQGASPQNIINRLATRGIHLEQSAKAREFHEAIAGAIARMFISRRKLLACAASSVRGRSGG
jgi:phage replication-related protein YjqB (UPF0714/DUF867 family)